MKFFINEEFERYILDAVSSAHELYYRNLSEVDKRILMNLRNATLDEKLLILGKLNHRFAIVVTKRSKMQPFSINRVKAIFRFLKHKVLNMIGDTLHDYGMFVMTDKEVMEGLTAVSCQARGEQYYILRDYEEIAAGIDRISHIYHKAAVELQAIKMVNAFISETYALPSRLRQNNEKDRYGVSYDQLPILFYLAAHPEGSIGYDSLGLHFGFGYNNTYFKKKMDQLVESGHCLEIEKSHYQLSGYGVHTVTQLRDRIYAGAST